jgi:hypothetical protein
MKASTLVPTALVLLSGWLPLWPTAAQSIWVDCVPWPHILTWDWVGWDWRIDGLGGVMPSPPRRFSHAMAYDHRRQVTVLFGGRDRFSGVALGDTWEFDGTTWGQKFPEVSPSARHSHQMSYDAARGIVVLYGGGDGSLSSDALWEWDGTYWRPVEPVGDRPPDRARHGMAYDSRRQKHVVFGGSGVGDTVFADTWEYDGDTRTWRLMAETGPPARLLGTLAFDVTHDTTVLYGGLKAVYDDEMDETLNLRDTWTWNGLRGTWTEADPRNRPVQSFGHSLAYDSRRGVVVLQNGAVLSAAFPDGPYSTRSTWFWNGTDWTAGTEWNEWNHPSPRQFDHPDYLGAMVYESDRDQMLYFGGRHDPDGSTWALRAYLFAGHLAEFDPLEVDGRTTSEIEDGTPEHPFRTVERALAVSYYNTISIRTGDYPEAPLRLCKPGRIVATGGPVSIR